MKILQINSVCKSGSTGKICMAVSNLLSEKEIENYILFAVDGESATAGIQYMTSAEIRTQALKSRIFGNYGFQSKKATKRLISEIERISPDIIHLHNLHSHNVNLEMLFEYLKCNRAKLFWTFHDCWAFTAYCPYYDLVQCNKWENEGCNSCPLRKKYSWFFDRSSYLFNKKRELFTGLDLTVITPSRWLADEVKKSFLKECDVKVINNGIDLSVFKPTPSDFRKKYNLSEKFIILGVAYVWSERKGVDVFIELLSDRLDDKYQIVLVGSTDMQLPDGIISISRTKNQRELAEIYSAADVFVNPTREDNFPTVNLEALACGTPVAAFNTGGCPETLDESCGIIVEKGNVDELVKAIKQICSQNIYSEEACVSRAADFKAEAKFREYIELYIG